MVTTTLAMQRAIMVMAMKRMEKMEMIQFSYKTTEYWRRKHQNAKVVTGSRASSREKFLFYCTHSGFIKQIFGLQYAAQLAYAAECILVLPSDLFQSCMGNKVTKEVLHTYILLLLVGKN
jgi:hypothetical protein